MEAINYLPQDMINSNYRYSVNNYYYTIRTNQNCYTQYNTTYCNCYDVYYNNNYLTTDPYSCNYNSSTNINYQNFSSDWHMRTDAPFIILYASFYIVLTIFILFTLLKCFRKAIRL